MGVHFGPEYALRSLEAEDSLPQLISSPNPTKKDTQQKIKNASIDPYEMKIIRDSIFHEKNEKRTDATDQYTSPTDSK